jgi:phenylacetate-coenzyme A ligase PaaK-like adenylate-forming protein
MVVEIAKKCIQDPDILRKFLISKFHEKLQFTPELKFVDWGMFPRNENKAKRIRKTW